MDISTLIEYIAGKDKSKAADIEKWLGESPDNKEEFFRLKELWAYKVAEECSTPQSLDKACENIKSSIHTAALRKRYRRSAVFAWSFACCLVAVLLAGTLLKNRMHDADIVLGNSSELVSLYSLPDGTKAFLRQGATLSYNNSFNSKDRNVRLSGEAYFDVKANEDLPFVVETPRMNVKVLGTTFNVHSAATTEVVLEKGIVSLCDSRGRQVAELLPGNRALVSENGKVDISCVQPAVYTRWRYNYKVYDSCSFDDFVTMVENRFDVRFIYDPSKFRDTYFRLAVSEGDTLEEMLSMMEYIAHIRYEQKGRNIYVNTNNAIN